MAASPKTQKATGSARKATGSAQKATGSAQKATGSARKATGSARKATGSARKATGSARKATGSAQKATGSARKATGSAQKATGSARKASSSSKKTTGSARKASSSSGKAAGSAQKARGSSRKATTSKPQKGIYVYGILPADIELTSEMPGVGDPPGQVRVIRSDGLAALVSDVDASMPLGSPEDLTAHQQIVDASAAAVPVLPARFGAVVESEEEVTEDLLGANHDEFDDALKEVDGRAQYVVKGRYAEKMILQEILSENRQAAHLADKLRDADPDATRDARIKLGEIVNEAVAAKRHKDTNALGHAMDGHCVASVVREPTHELDAVHVAFLVETDGEGEMEQAIEDLARDWEGRIEVRLLGPMAAYDFVGSALPEG